MTTRSRQTVERTELVPGYVVPRIICGGWQLSRGHRPGGMDPGETLRQLRTLVEAGFTAFDCGDIYLGVEELLGRLMRDAPNPRRIQVHTKFVPDRDDLARLDKQHVERIIDRSLSRLGVERLDLVQFAWWDFEVPRFVEAALLLDEQRRAGKVRLLGVTNFDVPHLAEIVDAGVPLAAHQLQYSLLDRRAERGMAEFCAENGIRLLAYGTLAGGFLSQRYLDRADPTPPLANRSLVKYRLIIEDLGGWDRFQDLLGVLSRIASRHGVSVSNVALRWVLELSGVAATIVGTFDATHLDDNLRVFGFALTEEDLRSLEPFVDAGPPGEVYAAERVPDGRHAAIMRYNLNREAED